MFVLIIATKPAQSEGIDVRGTVVDSSNGERLTGASVTIEGLGKGALTNLQGFYLILNVPPGTYRISASAVGYSQVVRLLPVGGQGPVIADFVLATRLIEVEGVTIESVGMDEQPERSASIHVISPLDLKSLPPTLQQDVFRSVALLPGVTSTSDVSARFYVRGGAADQNLILLDGMKLFNPFHAFGSLSTFDPEIVKSVEVYSGAFPAGYGGRLSSVLNVTSRDGNRSRIAGRAGINFISSELALEGPAGDDIGWIMSVRKSLSDKALKRFVPHEVPNAFHDAFLKGTMATTTGNIGLRGFLSADDITPADPQQPEHAWRSSAFGGSFSGLLTDRIYVDLLASYTRAEVQRIPKPATLIPTASSKIAEASLRAEFAVYAEDRDHASGGFEISFPSYQNSLTTRAGVQREFRDTNVEWWIWARYQWWMGIVGFDLGVNPELTSLFDIVLGNKPGYFLQSAQPRLMAMVSFGNTWLAKASFGVYTQNLITMNNEDDLISLFDAWLYLPLKLRPETAYHYVLGLEGKLFPPLSASLQAYIKDYRSITLYNPDKIFPEDPDYISGRGVSSGVEVLLRYAAPILDLYGSYTLSRARVESQNVPYAPRYDRAHVVKTMGTIHLPLRVDMTLRWEYGSGYPYTQNAGYYSRLGLGGLGSDPFPGGEGTSMRVLGPKNEARLPAYSRLDGSVTWQFNIESIRGTLGLTVLNLSGERNILYYDRTTGVTDYMIPFLPSAFIAVEF